MEFKILIGESDNTYIEILNDYFLSKGYTLLWSRDGDDLYNKCIVEKPSIVMIESLLPKGGAIKICNKLKSNEATKNIPIILISDVYKDFRYIYEERKKWGIEGYLEKPINLDELEQKIISLLELEKHISKPIEGDESVDSSKTYLLQGDLKNKSFVSLLRELYKLKVSGILSLEKESINKMVYFKKGILIYAYSNIPEESLGRALIKNGLITLEEYNTALEKMIRGRKQFWEVLTHEMKLISIHNIYEFLNFQVSERIYDLFSWDDGFFTFSSERLMLTPEFTVQLNPGDIIIEGLRLNSPFVKLEEYFADKKDKVLIQTKNPLFEVDKLKFRPSEIRLLSLINGKRKISQIIAESEMDEKDAKASLYIFINLGIVHTWGKPIEELSYISEDKVMKGVLDTTLTSSEEYKNMVDREYQYICGKNYFEILGVPSTAKNYDMKVAYHRLSKKWRPYELYINADKETKKKADTIFSLLTTAYENLSNNELKENYLKSLSEEERRKLYSSLEEEISSFKHSQGEISQKIETRKLSKISDERGISNKDEEILSETSSFEVESESKGKDDDLFIDDQFPSFKDESVSQNKIKDDDLFIDDQFSQYNKYEEKPIEKFSESDKFNNSYMKSLNDILNDDRVEEILQGSDQSMSNLDLGDILSSVSSNLEDDIDTNYNEDDIKQGNLEFQHGKECLKNKDFEGAIDAFQRAIKCNSTKSSFYAYLGWAIFNRSKSDEDYYAAMQMLKKATEIDPKCFEAYFYIGQIFLNRNEIDSAKRKLTKALEINPNSKEVRNLLKMIEEDYIM